jgi:hypothetical protein
MKLKPKMPVAVCTDAEIILGHIAEPSEQPVDAVPANYAEVVVDAGGTLHYGHHPTASIVVLNQAEFTRFLQLQPPLD